ncbi:helix-turn-helix domain-containing protein [Candidatus Falkowbacteria bacterium]|nr:helix-turn-helix domain-containing protein [Candidatus Falkowbacteria bacterium]
MKFVGKKISAIHETVGERLRDAREQKGSSLEKAAQETRIRKEYLSAYEEGLYDSLPKGVYRITFLKKYCDFLGLDQEKVKKEFLSETKNKRSDNKKISFSPKGIDKKEFIVFPKIAKSILIFIAVAAFFLYIGYYIRVSLSPPEVKIIEPADSLVTNRDSITVIGQTDVKTQVEINGRPVLNNEDGMFEQTIDLKKGVNIITIVAEKKHGPKTTINKQILVE